MRYRLLTLLALLVAATRSPAIESEPGIVRATDDSHTVLVLMDGRPEPLRVRLAYLAGPRAEGGGPDNPDSAGMRAAIALRDRLPRGTVVRLWTHEWRWNIGHDQTVEAVVLLDRAGWQSVQEAQIAAGWAVLDQRRRPLLEPNLLGRLQQAEGDARQRGLGAWRTDAEWMLDQQQRGAPVVGIVPGDGYAVPVQPYQPQPYLPQPAPPVQPPTAALSEAQQLTVQAVVLQDRAQRGALTAAERQQYERIRQVLAQHGHPVPLPLP
jgi:endonuclease YncB( thermonuclease family)